MKEKAIGRLIYNWNRLVAEGDMTKDAMVESLEDQISGYMDFSMEDLDGDPELQEITGYDVGNMTDEQADEWAKIVNEAAQRYINEEKVKWMDGETGEIYDEDPNNGCVPNTIEVQVPEEEWMPEDLELPFM